MNINSIFIGFLLCILLPENLTSKDLSQSPKDSIQFQLAESYYEGAFNNNELSSEEKIIIYQKADSIFSSIDEWEYSIYLKKKIIRLLQAERSYDLIDLVSSEAFQVAQNHLSKDNRYYWQALNLRGSSLFENKRDYQNAVQLFKEAKTHHRESKSFSSLFSALYINLSTCYIARGDYDLAIEQSQQTLNILLDSMWVNGAMPPTLENQLGIGHGKKKEYDLAIQHYKKGIRYAKESQPQKRYVDQVRVYLYQNLAELYLEIGKTDLSKKYINLALDFQKGQSYIKEAYTYQVLGKLLLKENKPQEAFDVFQTALALVKNEYKKFDKHPEISTCYFQNATAKKAQGEWNEALRFCQLALINLSNDFNSTDLLQNPLADQVINPIDAIDIIETKAKIYTQLFKENNAISYLQNAFTFYELAIQYIHKSRQSFNAKGSKFILAEKVIPVYEGAISLGCQLYEHTKKESWLKKAFQIAEENKGRTLLESINENNALSKSNIPDSLTQLEYDLKVDIAFYTKLIYETSKQTDFAGSDKINAWKNTRLDLKERYQNLIDYFEKNYSGYHQLKFKKFALSTNEIQSRLKQTTLIEFFVGQENIFVFTLNSNKIFYHKLNKNTAFEKKISDLRSTLNTAPNSTNILNDLNSYCTTANELYQLLLKPSLQRLPAETTHLTIVPDDLLAYLPFSILIDSLDQEHNSSFKNLAYLSNKYSFSYEYSASFWLKHTTEKKKHARKNFIAFAPVFNSYNPDLQLAPLSCNITEIERIAKLVHQPTILSKGEATLEQFELQSADYQIIHLATHTDLDNQNSSFNKIYFSDKYLSQDDLYQYQLKASLAVLSACNTGSGELKKGEGIMSLSRGFTFAGCPSILMSLWSVDDCATADIMFLYYEALSKGKTKNVALQNAKEQYLNQTTDILQSHPYYWSGFLQYGDVAPLSLKTESKWPFVLGVCLLLGLLVWFLIKDKQSVRT